MFLLGRPAEQAIAQCVADSQRLPLSYTPIGISTTVQAGYTLDEAVVTIGHGIGDFERARAALAGWGHFDLGWVELYPRRAPIEVGTCVVLLIRHLGFWSLNGCRIVRLIDDRDRDLRFGFAYGTLTNHAERGEEIFEVALDAATGNVTYHIRAVSSPRAILARVGYPISRALQARFRRHSAEVMRRAFREVRTT